MPTNATYTVIYRDPGLSPDDSSIAELENSVEVYSTPHARSIVDTVRVVAAVPYMAKGESLALATVIYLKSEKEELKKKVTATFAVLENQDLLHGKFILEERVCRELPGGAEAPPRGGKTAK